MLNLVPLLTIDEISVKYNGACIYSKFDINSGYYHIKLFKESQPKSTFVTLIGTFKFNHVPFG